MKFKQIKETCIYFKDLKQAREFYHDVLDLPIISELKDKHIFFRAGSSVLLCFNPDDSRHKKSPPAHYSEGKYHFAFEVPKAEYESQKKEFLQKGVSITEEIIWTNGLESFYFEDPIGNVVEIVPEGIWD